MAKQDFISQFSSGVIKLHWRPNSHADNQLSVLHSIKSSSPLCEVASMLWKIKKYINKSPVIGSRLSEGRSHGRWLSCCRWRSLGYKSSHTLKPPRGGAPPSSLPLILLFYCSLQTSVCSTVKFRERNNRVQLDLMKPVVLFLLLLVPSSSRSYWKLQSLWFCTRRFFCCCSL